MTRRLEQLHFDNTFARLPEHFYSRLAPMPFEKPAQLISFNPRGAEFIGLHPDEAGRTELLDYISGRQPWPGSAPLAMLYAGHQFGHYAPQLGDGRAVLLGEVRPQGANETSCAVRARSYLDRMIDATITV